MSITLFTGTPGSGKSFHCTEIVVNSLKKGINIITNYPIDTTKIKNLTIENNFSNLVKSNVNPTFLAFFV